MAMTQTPKIEGIVTHDESAMKLGECMIVKTVLEAKVPKKEIDLKNTNQSDLKYIEEKDPFLFYSIPGVRSAKMRMQDVDLTSVVKQQGSKAPRPASVWGQPNKVSAAQKVRRLSCVSVECHPDVLLLDGILGDDINDCMAMDDVSELIGELSLGN